MPQPIEDVRVNLLKTATHGYRMEVCIRSHAKKAMSGDIWLVSTFDIDRNVLKMVQYNAAALAVKQNLENGDNHDPDEIARVAQELAREVLIESAHLVTKSATS